MAERVANTYADPRLLDVAGAMEVLPSLPLSDGPQAERPGQALPGVRAAGHPC